MCISNEAAKLLLFLIGSGLAVDLANAQKDAADILLTTGKPLMHMDNANIDAKSDFEQLIEAKYNETAATTTTNQKLDLLSRKRRYLVFPEGSSFQMVFDEYICVVDHTNYLVLGITVALAWELPSKPPSEAIQDILNKLEDGTIDVSRNDTVSNITYVDDAAQTPSEANTNNYNKNEPNYIKLYKNGGQNNNYYSNSPVFRTPMHPTYQYADSYYRPARRKDSNYYDTSPARNPFPQWSQSFSKAQSTRYPYWALPTRLRNTHRNGYYRPADANYQANSKNTEKVLPNYNPPRLQHKIYPVFGKRSLPDKDNSHQRHRRSGVASVPDDKLSRTEAIHIKYHRNSRQTLYERIEKYLDKRGVNGHHCVLRTLCETGQKSHEQDPGSFVGELLRAIFTIPEALDHEPVAYRDTHYDKAHAHRGDCAALYPECKESIWDAPFIQ